MVRVFKCNESFMKSQFNKPVLMLLQILVVLVIVEVAARVFSRSFWIRMSGSGQMAILTGARLALV